MTRSRSPLLPPLILSLALAACAQPVPQPPEPLPPPPPPVTRPEPEPSHRPLTRSQLEQALLQTTWNTHSARDQAEMCAFFAESPSRAVDTVMDVAQDRVSREAVEAFLDSHC